MKKICIIFGHHNSKSSFNAAIKDTFINEAKARWNKVQSDIAFKQIDGHNTISELFYMLESFNAAPFVVGLISILILTLWGEFTKKTVLSNKTQPIPPKIK